MEMKYDKESDALYIKFSDKQVFESKEKESDIIIDYDIEKNIVGVEFIYFLEKHSKETLNVFKEIEQVALEQELIF